MDGGWGRKVGRRGSGWRGVVRELAMVWEGKDVVLTGRRIIGATRPWEAAPGTIRGDHAVEVGRNVIHGSDSVENGKKEIALWFPGGLAEWKSNLHPWIYEN